MRTLTLKDGTQYELDWCNGDKGIFYANIITDASIAELAGVFGDEDRTSVIHADLGSSFEKTYEGYTKLQSISVGSWSTGTTLITLYTPEREAVG